MTSAQTTILLCDATHTECTETVVAKPGETNFELRRRAMRVHGWRYTARERHVQDLCRWHA